MSDLDVSKSIVRHKPTGREGVIIEFSCIPDSDPLYGYMVVKTIIDSNLVKLHVDADEFDEWENF